MRRLRCMMLSGAIAACSDGGGGGPPIAIGVVESRTGDLLAQGRNQEKSLMLAIDEINAAGGVLGRPLTLAIQDDGTTEQGTANAYRTHIEAGVPVILGPEYSAGVFAVAAQIRQGKTLTVSGGAAAPGLGTFDDGNYFFRTVPSDAVQAVVLARLIVSKGCQRVCIVHRSDPYGNGLAGELLRQLGSQVEATESSYDPEHDALPGEVVQRCEAIRSQLAAGIVFITFEADGMEILDDAARRGWNTVDHHIFFVDGNRRQELFNSLEENHRAAFLGAVGTAASGPPLDDGILGERRRAFKTRFEQKHDGTPPGQYAENEYDAAYLAATAIEIAGSPDDREAIRDAMLRTRTGPVIAAPDWAGIRVAIAAYGQIDYLGASGDVTLDPDNGELLPPYYIRQWIINDQGQIEDQDVVTVTGP